MRGLSGHAGLAPQIVEQSVNFAKAEKVEQSVKYFSFFSVSGDIMELHAFFLLSSFAFNLLRADFWGRAGVFLEPVILTDN
jgi:hypothetical protein